MYYDVMSTAFLVDGISWNDWTLIQYEDQTTVPWDYPSFTMTFSQVLYLFNTLMPPERLNNILMVLLIIGFAEVGMWPASFYFLV